MKTFKNCIFLALILLFTFSCASTRQAKIEAPEKVIKMALKDGANVIIYNPCNYQVAIYSLKQIEPIWESIRAPFIRAGGEIQPSEKNNLKGPSPDMAFLKFGKYFIRWSPSRDEGYFEAESRFEVVKGISLVTLSCPVCLE